MRVGIIGTGKIVHEALFAMENIGTIEKTAIFARPHSQKKGEQLADQYGIPSVYTDYEKLLADDKVDCVYIGLVNSAHYSYAKKALEAGKHVILEKPFTSTVAEAEDLARTARKQGRFVLEAITVLHGELYHYMEEMLPKLGPLKLMQCNYSQYSSRFDRYKEGEVAPAFDPALSGGALYDINLYNIYYCIGLLGAPKKAAYFPNTGFNGIDTSGIAILQYPKMTACCSGAKDSDSPSYIIVQGEKGWMRLNGKPNVPGSLTAEIFDEEHPESVPDKSGGMARPMIRTQIEPTPVRHRMTPEFMDFARIVDEHDEAEAAYCLNRSLAVMRVLEHARKEAGIRFGVDNVQ